MEEDFAQEIGLLLAATKMGIIIDRWDEEENGTPCTVHISVPEHSEEKAQNNVELSGNILSKRFQKILSESGKTVNVIAEIRNGETWTKEAASMAIEEMKKKLHLPGDCPISL